MALLIENILNDFGHVPSAAGFGFESTFDSMFDDIDNNSDSIDDGYWETKSPLSLSDSDSPHPMEAILPEIGDLEQDLNDEAQPFNYELDVVEQFIADELQYSPSAAVCDCTALKLKCSAEDISPVLRDCMWSGTSGLVPMIVSADGKPCVPLSSGAGNGSDFGCKMEGHVADSCSICTSCVSQTSMSMCVDPKSVFPYPECRPQTTSSVFEESCRTPPITSSTLTSSAVYDPDSETSAYSSAVSDEEPEEIDVVSVPLSSLNSSCSSRLTSPSSSPSPRASLADRREMLVLPASESVSAQVAAMHNYSSTRCRPTTSSSSSSSSSSPMTLSTHSLHTIKRKYAKRPVVSAKGRSRHHTTTTYSGSDSSEDSWANGDNEDDRCRRAQHNVMERRRRHHLKGNFFRLRDVIPDIAGDGRVSKVAILCRARDYIGRLTASERAMQAEYDQLCAAQSKLKWQLSLVQREQRLTAVSS